MVRFARYCKLDSWARTPWRPDADLPVEYSRLAQFTGFRAVAAAAVELFGESFEPIGRGAMHREPNAPEVEGDVARALDVIDKSGLVYKVGSQEQTPPTPVELAARLSVPAHHFEDENPGRSARHRFD